MDGWMDGILWEICKRDRYNANYSAIIAALGHILVAGPMRVVVKFNQGSSHHRVLSMARHHHHHTDRRLFIGRRPEKENASPANPIPERHHRSTSWSKSIVAQFFSRLFFCQKENAFNFVRQH